MLTLVIDTATPSVTAGVFEVAETVTPKGDHAVVDARGHGERLAPMIDASLKDAAAVPGDLAAIVVGLGPGPFTGLRVGLVTAASMADALGIPAYGVCSLDALGLAAARSVEDPGRILVATDARRKEVYWGLYDEEGRRLLGPEVEKPDRLQPHIAEAAHLAGDGAVLYPQHFPEVLEAFRFPPAWAFAELAADRVRAKAPTEPLTPLYLRRPDVHVNGKQQRL